MIGRKEVEKLTSRVKALQAHAAVIFVVSTAMIQLSSGTATLETHTMIIVSSKDWDLGSTANTYGLYKSDSSTLDAFRVICETRPALAIEVGIDSLG